MGIREDMGFEVEGLFVENLIGIMDMEVEMGDNREMMG